jgi:hypothetical protein
MLASSTHDANIAPAWVGGAQAAAHQATPPETPGQNDDRGCPNTPHATGALRRWRTLRSRRVRESHSRGAGRRAHT